MTSATEDLACVLHGQIRSYGSAPFIEFAESWYSGDDITGYVDSVETLIGEAGVSEHADVAVVVRNRPQHAAIILGLLGLSRSFSLVYAFQSPEALAQDIERLRPAVVIADRQDWTRPVVEATQRVGSIGIALSLRGDRVTLLPELGALGEGPFRASERPAIGVLTSGTTGPPKRIHLPTPVLERAVLSGTALSAEGGEGPPDLVFWPFGGIGGIAQLVASAYLGKRIVLLEKFTVAEWVGAVKRYRMPFVGVQPAVVRMVLDAGVPREDLASLRFLFGGAGPLEPETRERFEQIYGVPIFWAYGATEFAGTLISWTPGLYREFGKTKRDTSGKPTPGTQVRIVDVTTGQEVACGEQGFLEAKVPVLGPDWIRTTDIASIDQDGFVTLHGRGDGAINRGGFKVLPDTVVTALLTHPAVRDACVVGVPDPRLGDVPFAAVELATGLPAPGVDELKAFLRHHVPAHHIPVDIRIVEQLPRTPALKVSLQAVKAMYGS